MLRAQEICKEIFGKDPDKSVNPDLAVSIGAAIQASVLAGDLANVTLLDVTPLTLSLETCGGLATTMIGRNSTIPCQKVERFSTAIDNQPAVDIHVLQGEHRMASGNRTLGRFQLTGIPPQARGKPNLEVAFDINADGILSVTAKDQNTGKEQKVEIKSSSGLDKADIERMIADAKVNEKEENEKVELIETRNRADNLVYYTEKFISENQKVLTEPTRAKVTAAIYSVKNAMTANVSKADLDTTLTALESTNETMHAECYGQANQVKPPAPVVAVAAPVPNPAHAIPTIPEMKSDGTGFTA